MSALLTITVLTAAGLMAGMAAVCVAKMPKPVKITVPIRTGRRRAD